MPSPLATRENLEQAMHHLQKNDPLLSPIINHHGIPTIVPHTAYYQSLVESIISQQLSVKAAATILKRFVALFPDTSFPSPSDILRKDSEAYRAVGLSRQKASYIQDLALKVIEGEIDFLTLNSLSNEEIITKLTKVKGVGVWTVHMFLMFCMGRLDVLPVGDLGIRNGIQKIYNYTTPPTPEEIRAVAMKNQWHPYETVASWFIWRSLDNTPVLEPERL